MVRDVLKQIAACDRKRAYATRERAEAVARDLRRTYGGFQLRAYECPMCGLWHLTKKARKE